MGGKVQSWSKKIKNCYLLAGNDTCQTSAILLVKSMAVFCYPQKSGKKNIRHTLPNRA